MSLTGPDIDTLQHQFDAARAAILASAIGVARLQLREDQCDQALDTLETAVRTTRKLHRDYLARCGYSETAILDILQADLL